MWDAYNHFMPPNSLNCAAANDLNVTGGGGTTTTGAAGWGSFMNAIPPSCNHPGGVNVCFVDGRVQFIKNNIEYRTWWGLGTRNGQEAISSDAY
jgi:prepilin-type processing-associated H-X9-DG protein